jgi:hypothetical protein
VSSCINQIALSNDQEHLYHFACQKIARAEMKKSVATMKTIEEISQPFSGYKVISGPDFFLWLSLNQGLRMYAVDT